MSVTTYLPRARRMIVRAKRPHCRRVATPRDSRDPRLAAQARNPAINPIKAPRREPAGRRAVGQNRSPEAPSIVLHQPGPKRLHSRIHTGTYTARRRAVRQNRPRCPPGPGGDMRPLRGSFGSDPGDFATGCMSGRSRLAGESQRFPGSCACPRPDPSHKSPPARAGGTAGRWAKPVPGSPLNRPTPARPKTLAQPNPHRDLDRPTAGRWAKPVPGSPLPELTARSPARASFRPRRSAPPRQRTPAGARSLPPRVPAVPAAPAA